MNPEAYERLLNAVARAICQQRYELMLRPLNMGDVTYKLLVNVAVTENWDWHVGSARAALTAGGVTLKGIV